MVILKVTPYYAPPIPIEYNAYEGYFETDGITELFEFYFLLLSLFQNQN